MEKNQGPQHMGKTLQLILSLEKIILFIQPALSPQGHGVLPTDSY